MSAKDSEEEAASSKSTISSASVLGEIVWLFCHSKLHQNWPIGSIQQWVLPAIHNGFFRLYRQNGKPHGYVSWALLSKEVEEAYVLNTASLHPDHWKSGDRGWIIDYVAPFGGAGRIAYDLKYNLFKDKVGRYLRVKPGTDTAFIKYLHGAEMAEQAKDHTFNPTVELKDMREK